MSFNVSYCHVHIQDNVVDYSKELELNVQCGVDDTHIAVLYCRGCKANYCRICSDTIHAIKSFSKHEVVRLTEKPEPPTYCHLHPQTTAYLVCKESSCEGKNIPMCIMCYKTHRDHKYEVIGNEYNQLTKSITNSLGEIDTKRADCDKSLQEYDTCISRYSGINDDFLRNQRYKVDKFYSDARTLALKTFDDFVDNRIEKLKVLRSECVNDKIRLNNLRKFALEFESMSEPNIIENEDMLEGLARHAGKDLDEPRDVVPFTSYNIKYPNDSINIEIAINHTDISKSNQLQSPQKTLAVFFINCNLVVDHMFSWLVGSDEALTTEKVSRGRLYSYEHGRSILELKYRPLDSTVNLSQYKYMAVIGCWSGDEQYGKDLLKEQMKNSWCSRIIVLVTSADWDNEKKFVEGVQKIARTDKRVNVMKNPEAKPIDFLFENQF